jgi:hypothetical protein
MAHPSRLAGLALLGLSLAAPLAATAQMGPGTYSGVRAINLARNTAIRLNGGLSVYQPAACMFNTGSNGGSCLVSLTEQGYRYRFAGGAPGWQQLGLPATTETELLVAPDGRSVLEVLYNGSPRPGDPG